MMKCAAKPPGECRVAPSELLAKVADVFERLNIPYFVTGSVATIAYGEFRSTADVDIVAKVALPHVRALCESFADDRFYISADAITDAIRNRGQFNIIDSMSGYKADIMIPGSSPLDALRFQRAVRIPLQSGDREYWFSSPEDVIIKKLDFYREGQSDKHLRDIAGILKTMGEQLDRAYIVKWAAQLDVLDIWQAVVNRVEGP